MGDDDPAGKPTGEQAKDTPVTTPASTDTDAKDMMTIPVKDFIDLQNENSKLEKDAKEADDKVDSIKKEHTMAELKKLNPKLAEANKDADFKTLEVVLKTALSMKGEKGNIPNFPEGEGEGLQDKLASPGYRLMGSKEWIVKTT